MTPPLRIVPYRDIAAEIAQRLVAARGTDPLAAWAEEVIVPSAGVSQAIARELLDRVPNGLAALQLQTLETLARRIVNAAGEFPRVASEAERRLAMRIATRTVEHRMMESRGIAAMLERSYRDVRDSAVTLAELAPKLRGERKKTILRAWTEYERVIARLGAIDPADLLRRATALAPSADLRPQLVAGFYDMTFAQRRFVEALPVAAMWVPTAMPLPDGVLALLSGAAGASPAVVDDDGRPKRPELHKAYDDALARLSGATGASPADADDERRPKRPPLHEAYDTRHTELAETCASVANLLANGIAARDIGIVARSLEPYDVALVERFAAQHGFRTTLAVEVPLAAHRVGRGAVTLLRLRERGFPRGEVLELVRDGLRTRTQLDVDAADYHTRRARIAGGTSQELNAMRGRRREVDDYIALVAELEELTASIDLSRLSALFRLETELDLAAAEALDEIAVLFRRAGVSDLPSVLDAIEHVSLEPHAANNGLPVVWAGDVLRFRGRSFQHLFVVRMQDDVFPQRRVEDPLFPDADRRAHGIRTIGDGADEEKLLFQLLLDSSGQVTFSYAASDGFGKVLRPSRFVRTVGGWQLAVGGGTSHRQLPTANRQLRATRRQLQLLVKAGTGSPFDGYVTTVRAEIAQRLQAVSPTQLEDFGECPQKFLLKHILGAEDIDHPERELQIHHREKGTIDHRILERFYRTSDRTLETLDRLIDEAFDTHEAEMPPFNRTIRGIERRATKRLLREFVETDLAELEAERLEPKFFEYRFGHKHRDSADHAEPYVVTAAGVPIRIEGTIDRIDGAVGDQTTRFRIVDYKSGKALRHAGLGEKIDRGVRLQLALYAMAVAEFFEVDPNSVAGAIKPLVVADAKPAKFAFALGEKRDGLVETLEIFVSSILTGIFPAFPIDTDFEPCKYCPVNHSCRTRHDSDERHAAQQQKDPRSMLKGSS